MIRRALIGFAAVVAGIGLAACGGGDDSGTDGTSADDFVTEANGICVKADQAYFAIYAPVPGERRSTVDQMNRSADVFDQRNEDLAALTPPDEAATDYEALLRAFEDEAAGVRMQAEGAAAGNDITQAQAKASQAHDDANAAGAAAGLDDCGEVLPQAAVDEVEANLSTVASRDIDEVARGCHELTTENYLKLNGGLRSCITTQGSKAPIDFDSTHGVEGVSAETFATFSDDFTYDAQFVYEDGAYKLDGISLIDRGK